MTPPERSEPSHDPRPEPPAPPTPRPERTGDATGPRPEPGPSTGLPPCPGPPGDAAVSQPDPGAPRSSPSSASDEEVPAGLRRFFGGSWEDTTRYADAAGTLFGGLLGLGLLGWIADRILGTFPAGLLIGLLLGMAVGLYRLGRTMLGPR